MSNRFELTCFEDDPPFVSVLERDGPWPKGLPAFVPAEQSSEAPSRTRGSPLSYIYTRKLCVNGVLVCVTFSQVSKTQTWR